MDSADTQNLSLSMKTCLFIFLFIRNFMKHIYIYIHTVQYKIHTIHIQIDKSCKYMSQRIGCRHFAYIYPFLGR